MILLDISRLLSRIGTGPLTGIDRVERAWLEHLQGQPHGLIARVAKRQLLLAPEAGADLLGWLDDPASLPPAKGLIAALRPRNIRVQAQEVTAARAQTTGLLRGIGLRHGLTRMGAKTWLAVGHANLASGPWRALQSLNRVVLIHDTIPLDLPDQVRPGQALQHQRRVEATLTHADLVLTVSEATRADLIRWREKLRLPDHVPIVATPIGTTLSKPRPEEIPADLPLDRPFFVVLSTIEPRKNHLLLLDVWERLAKHMPAADLPRLLILGRRGWDNPETFARLDALPKGGAVIERAGLTDGAVAALLDQAHGLLSPSRAEGFGMPLAEAAVRGVPVLSSPLPAVREMLGDAALWLDPDDVGAWAGAVRDLASAPLQRRDRVAVRPWSAHFSQVEALLDTAGKEC